MTEEDQQTPSLLTSYLPKFVCAAVVFYAVLGWINSRAAAAKAKTKKEEEEEIPYPPPFNDKQDMTVEELAKFDGSDLKKPLLLCCNGVIYDVGEGKDYYGKGGPYSFLAGR
eukprot:scaffold527_cov368-Prasinococcus_capsulatus_cf.AAC.28